MSTTINVTVPTYNSAITIPTAGDIQTVQSATDPMVALAKNAEWVRRRAFSDTAATPTTVRPIQGGQMSSFTINGTYGVNFSQSSTASVGQLVIPAIIPTSGYTSLIVTSFGCVIKGNSGHAGLPGTMPVVNLIQHSGLTAYNVQGTVTDTASTVPLYQAEHSVAYSGAAIGLYAGPVWLEFKGESGANAVTGLIVGKFFISFYFA